MSYLEEFKTALLRNSSFGLTCPQFEVSRSTFLTSDRLAKLPEMLEQRVGAIDLRMLVAQCLFIHASLREDLEAVLEAPCYFTLGYVETSVRNMFYQSEESLKRLMEEGIQGPSLNIHAWLTFSSMEILDLSLSTSYAVINNEKQGLGAVIANHADRLKDGLRYHPMLVGEDFLLKTGAMRVF